MLSDKQAMIQLCKTVITPITPRMRVLWVLCIIAGFLTCLRGHALCIKVKEANLRSGPGSRFPVSWIVGRYTPFVKIGKKKRWIRVRDLDGEIHWIHQSLVEDSARCVSVKVRYTNLRTGPGRDFPRSGLARVDKYTSFKTLGGEDGWIKVQDEFGHKYYVYMNNVWRPSTYYKLNL